MRQLDDGELVGSFEDVGVLGSGVRRILEARGVRFEELTEHTEAGPVQVAAVALDDGSQFLLVHHYAHPEGFVDLRGQVGAAIPAELCRRFAAALDLGDGDFSWVADGWPRSAAD